jgi:hypothetical protein
LDWPRRVRHGADRARTPGLSDQSLGYADLLSPALGALERHGLKAEEFGVPSGNSHHATNGGASGRSRHLCGPSFILGHDKGGLIGIAVIAQVGRTTRVMARKDLGSPK